MSEIEISSLKNELNLFRENGHCVIRKIISNVQINKLFSYLDEIIEYLKESGDEGSYINYANKKVGIVNSIHRINELNHSGINKFVRENNFKGIAEILIGEECELFAIQAFLKPPNMGLKTPPHQDNAYWCQEGNGGITLWIALDEAGKFNGMMQYALNSNKKLFDHISSTNTPGSSLIIAEKDLEGLEWIQPNLKPGDISIHDGLVIHYSEKNNSNIPRRGLLLNYRSVNCKKDMKKFKNYIQKLEKIYGKK